MLCLKNNDALIVYISAVNNCCKPLHFDCYTFYGYRLGMLNVLSPETPDRQYELGKTELM
jgi:hypothetical protein